MIQPLLSLAFSIHASKGVFALLLGSGVSRSSGIPTGWEIVLDLVHQIAHLEGADCGHEPEKWYEDTYRDAPRYDKLLETVAKSPAERNAKLRAYFEPTDDERLQGLKLPTKAHTAIATMVTSGHIRVIMTTNFDRLLEIALVDVGVTPTVLSTADALKHAIPLAHSRCTIIKLHGDYLETSIRNTPEELSTYDPQMDALLAQILDEYGLVVCGWSAASDVALAQALRATPSHRFTTYWTTRNGLSGTAKELSEARWAQVLSIRDADTFFTELGEKVSALDDLSGSGTLSTAVAVARLKRYLPDETQRIRVHDLLIDACSTTEATLVAKSSVAVQHPDELFPVLDDYHDAVDLLQGLIIAGCFWGTESHDRLWAECMSRVSRVPSASQPRVVYPPWQQYPTLRLLYAAGIAAIAGGNIGRAICLLASVKVRMPIGVESAAIALHPGNVLDRDLMNRALKKEFYVPASDYLHDNLRQVFLSYVPSDEEYTNGFDVLEYCLGLVHLEARSRQSGRSLWGPVGAFGYRYRGQASCPISAQVVQDVERAGLDWAPYKLGLFGGNPTEFLRLRVAYDDCVSRARSSLW